MHCLLKNPLPCTFLPCARVLLCRSNYTHSAPCVPAESSPAVSEDPSCSELTVRGTVTSEFKSTESLSYQGVWACARTGVCCPFPGRDPLRDRLDREETGDCSPRISAGTGRVSSVFANFRKEEIILVALGSLSLKRAASLVDSSRSFCSPTLDVSEARE